MSREKGGQRRGRGTAGWAAGGTLAGGAGRDGRGWEMGVLGPESTCRVCHVSHPQVSSSVASAGECFEQEVILGGKVSQCWFLQW